VLACRPVYHCHVFVFNLSIGPVFFVPNGLLQRDRTLIANTRTFLLPTPDTAVHHHQPISVLITMSSDEPVEDPYLTLGVAKDADIAAIRSAHRKLVLKYHPDRLKGEEEQAKGKDAFQKVQQAYEILSDPTTRARHDNKVKLAQLKKEAMTRDPPPRTAAFPMRPPPPSTPNRDHRDGIIYEERAPSASYFDEGYRYREEEPRTTSRKYDGYERERRPEFGQPEKERKSSKWPEKTSSDLPFNIALKFKAKAQKTREAVKEKTREKEMHASSAKSRDRDHRSARMDKQSNRRAYVEDDDSSDSDTATYVTVNRPSPRPSKSPYDSSPRTRSKPDPPRRSAPNLGEEDGDEEDKWHGIHVDAKEYIERSQRPGISGRSSSSRTYWEFADDRQSGRKSGSDSEKRPQSSKGRRPSIDVHKPRPPPMPSHNSAPDGIATMKAQLDKDAPRSKQRASTGATASRSSPKDVPSMSRAQTMPSSKSRKGDAVPTRGSNLKHAETHDSGYGSSGGQTPDLSGTSPPRYGPIRYQIVEDEDDLSTILVDPEDRHRRTTSPSPPQREHNRRDHPQKPTISTDSRPRSSRGASYQQHSPIEIEPRPTAYRQDSARSTQPRSSSPQEPPSGRRNSERGGKLFAEMDRNEPYVVRYPNVKTSPRVNEKDIKYTRHVRRPSTDESDREPHPRYREALRSPTMGARRGSAS
jgi:curved DNA-binding protein CbpA